MKNKQREILLETLETLVSEDTDDNIEFNIDDIVNSNEFIYLLQDFEEMPASEVDIETIISEFISDNVDIILTDSQVDELTDVLTNRLSDVLDYN